MLRGILLWLSKEAETLPKYLFFWWWAMHNTFPFNVGAYASILHDICNACHEGISYALHLLKGVQLLNQVESIGSRRKWYKTYCFRYKLNIATVVAVRAWMNDNTVYPKKYAHGFVVLCFVVVMQSFIMNSYEVFIHIHQGCFAGTGAFVRLPQCQWSKPDGYGKISQCITTTKHSKAKTVCKFLGIYCSQSCLSMSCPK